MSKKSLNLNRAVSNHPSNQGLIGWWLGLPQFVGGPKYWDITPYHNHAVINPYSPPGISSSWANVVDGNGKPFGALMADGVRSGGYGICHGADVQVMNGVASLPQNKPLTISAYIRNNQSSDGQFLTVDDSGGNPTVYNSNGNGFGLRYYKVQNQSNGIAYVNAPCAVTPGPWHYLFTQDAGAMYMYANGVLYNSANSISSFSNPINRVWFGRNTFTNGGEGMYSGELIGDVRIRAGATSKAEAAFVYQEWLKGYPNLLAWRSFVSLARPATSTTVTASITQASLSLTPQTVTVTLARSAAISQASLSLAAQTVTTSIAAAAAITQASLSLAPQTVTTSITASAAVSQGSLSLTPQTVTTSIAASAAVSQASLSLTPQTVTTSIAVSAAVAQALLTLAAQTISYTIVPASPPPPPGTVSASIIQGSLSLTPQTITAAATFSAAVSQASLALTPQTITATVVRSAAIVQASLSLAAQTITTSIAASAAITQTSLTLAAQTISYTIVPASPSPPPPPGSTDVFLFFIGG